tara:strand:- start:865 stop:1041 length:177 start_codon:yes stop_codon:yes gene_type:complete
MTPILSPFNGFLLFFGFKRIVGSKMNQFCIRQFVAESAYCHFEFAGQKKLKIEPAVLL